MELTPILEQMRRQKTNKPAPHTDHLFTCPDRGFFLFFSPFILGVWIWENLYLRRTRRAQGTFLQPPLPGVPLRPPRATLSPDERRPGSRDLPCSTAPLPLRGAAHRRRHARLKGGQENSVERKKRERSAQRLAPPGAAALPVPAGDVRAPGVLGKAAAPGGEGLPGTALGVPQLGDRPALPAENFCGVWTAPWEPSVPVSLPTRSRTRLHLRFVAICLVPAAPRLARLQNKGEEKPQVDPSLPTKPPFVQVPEENCVHGEGGGCTRAALSRKRYNFLFQELTGKISFARSLFNFIYVYIFFFRGYLGSSCCRREADPSGLICFSSGKTSLGRDRPGTENGTRFMPGSGGAQRPPVPASRGAEPVLRTVHGERQFCSSRGRSAGWGGVRPPEPPRDGSGGSAAGGGCAQPGGGAAAESAC
ncbi:uncharacterized protein LOC131582255 [Poecile atricapillus]|uniref:uncharacterized protein LOC131582255 n=1 Tax=Poecile atricapillus TaxID=48891 RepID=UPI0027397254|nr:uncharacterized protein LOC131582255 [Poecile atricapillus]